MQVDYLAFRRATSVSLLGLAIQLVLSLGLALFGYFSRDGSAAVTAGIFAGLGVPIWLALAILFDQHRRERIEAMESQTLADSDISGSSVFEAAGDEMKVASRRLAGMIRFMLPAVGLLTSASLLTIGILRIGPAREAAADALLNPPDGSTPGLFVGLAVGFVGFIFARYTSGMAKQDAWAPLRGGAAFAVGTALFGAFIAVAHFVRIAGPDVLLRIQPVVFAVALIVVGTEILLNLLVDLYRPRKAGDPIRPAFDSRIMAFFAAPDKIAESISEAINYQFGFNVTGTWFYQLVSKALFYLIALGFIVVWLLSGIVVVEPDQRVLILRNGRVTQGNVGPGLHFKAPWPIGRVVMPEYVSGSDKQRLTSATAVRTIDLGTVPPRSDGKPILWTEDHALNERFTLVRSSTTNQGTANDLALVAVEAPLKYAITDVEVYETLGPPIIRDELIQAVGRREVMLYLSALTVDEILGIARPVMANELRSRIQTALDKLNVGPDGIPRGTGIEILFVGPEGVHPPKDTAEGFENVVNAQQKRERRILLAQARSIETLTSVVGSVDLAERIVEEIDRADRMNSTSTNPAEVALQEQRIEALLAEAGGEASTTILDASAERWSTHMAARANATQYTGQIASYLANPTLYTASARFKALANAMENSRVYITDDRIPLHIRMNLEDRQTSVDVFDADTDLE